MTTTHRYREQWVNMAHVAKVEHGTRPHALLVTFDSPRDCEEFLESLCTGRELVGGGIRHDQGKHCPVHPDHDDH